MRSRGLGARRAAVLTTLAVSLALPGCTKSTSVCVNDRCTLKADGAATTTIGDDGRAGSIGSDELVVGVDRLQDGSVEVDVGGDRRTLRQGQTVSFGRARVTVVRATAEKVELRVLR